MKKIILLLIFLIPIQLFAQYEMNVSPEALIDSARKGDPDAMFDLGNCMLEGICPGIERNDSQSIYWMQRAAALGNPAGLSMIGLMHCTGENRYVKLDKNKGKRMFNQVLSAGDPIAEVMVKQFIHLCD